LIDADYLHGLASYIAIKEIASESILATDLIENISKGILSLHN
jgi:hypothetical protein